MKLPEIPESVLKYAPWSATGITKALDCPLSFNCNHEKLEKTNLVDDSDSKVGSAIHQYLESILEDISKVSSKEVLASAFFENNLTYGEATRVSLLREAAITSARRIIRFKEAHAAEKIEIEAALAIDKDFNIVPFFDKKVLYRGKIDVAMQGADGSIFIVDHKSGAKTDIDPVYQAQLISYILLYALYKFQNTEINKETTGTFYLNVLGGDTPNILKGETISFAEFEEKIVLPWFERLKAAAASAETREAREGFHCKYCEYQGLCPLKKKTDT
jgi:RecB family exonuclease